MDDAGRILTPLRTVLVGLGRIGVGFHAGEIRRHPGFRLVGVVDTLPERRAEAEREWQVPAGGSVGEMLRATQPDLVVVASPTGFHREHACEAFAQGAHVLCEKPVACSVVEFDRILEAGRTAGRKFLAYQQYRLKPEFRALKAIIHRDVIGRIHLIKRAHCGYARRGDWQAFRAYSGGLLNNYASHFLDEAMALLDNEGIRSVYCLIRHAVTAGDAEDVVKIVLVTESGLIVDFDISQASAQPVEPWQVFGGHGATTWSAVDRAWKVKYFQPEEAPPVRVQSGLAAEGRLYPGEKLPWHEELMPAADYPELDYYDLAWRYFARGDAPPVTPEESRQLIQLIERCRQSAATGAVA